MRALLYIATFLIAAGAFFGCPFVISSLPSIFGSGLLSVRPLPEFTVIFVGLLPFIALVFWDDSRGAFDDEGSASSVDKAVDKAVDKTAVADGQDVASPPRDFKESLRETVTQMVLERADPEQVGAILTHPMCELDETFLGAMDVYAGASLIVPPGFHVIDFGCDTGIQSALFPHAASYTGIDLDFGDNPPRYEGPGITHFYGSAQEWLDANADSWADKPCVAICSYLPDSDAKDRVRDVFESVIDFYPAAPEGGWTRPSSREPETAPPVWTSLSQGDRPPLRQESP